MGDQQSWRAVGDPRRALGTGEVVRARNRRAGSLDAGSQAAHQRPHQCAVRLVEAQDPCAGVVAGTLQIGVEKPKRQVAATVCLQVHGHERHVAEHIDAAQRRGELDAVERRRLAVDQHRVGQMQVAMAFAHVTVVLPRTPCLAQRMSLRGEPGVEHGHARSFAVRPQLLQHIEYQPYDPLRRLVRRCGRRNRCVLVKCGHLPGEAFEMFGQQGARRQPFAEQRAGRNASHAHRVVDRLAGPVDARRLRGSAHGSHAQVQRWREAPVQAQLFLAKMPAQSEGAEVGERQAHRLLQLVRQPFSEQHPRDVRLHERHRLSCLGLQVFAQRVDQRSVRHADSLR